MALRVACASGRELLRRSGQLGLAQPAWEKTWTAPTGTVTVKLTADGQPKFTIHETSRGTAWPAKPQVAGQSPPRTRDVWARWRSAARSHARRIQALLKAAPAESLRILDVNLRQDYFLCQVGIEESLALASVLKVNETELARLAEMFGLLGDEGRGGSPNSPGVFACGPWLTRGVRTAASSIPRAGGPSVTANASSWRTPSGAGRFLHGSPRVGSVGRVAVGRGPPPGQRGRRLRLLAARRHARTATAVHAPLSYDGKYHHFYQRNPFGDYKWDYVDATRLGLISFSSAPLLPLAERRGIV